ncbi:MAG TPA: hypothetical protein VM283_05295, partial [Armatimonadota bacterium]|nr:hypothetical protein [Armatimonadota bacterium]
MRLILIVVLGLASVWACSAQAPLTIAEEVTLPGGGEQSFTFDRPTVPEGQMAVVHFRGRLQSERQGGHTPGVRVYLNGTELDDRRLVNKPRELQWGAGRIASWWGRGFRLMYSPDLEGNNREDNPYYIYGGQAYTFDLDVTDLLAAGENTLRLAHVQPAADFTPAIIVDLRIEVREAVEGHGIEAGPPTGPLPFIAPAKPASGYAVSSTPGGGVLVTVAGQQFRLDSSFTHERGGWNVLSGTGAAEGEEGWQVEVQPAAGGFSAHARARDYAIERTVSTEDECIAIEDTVTNISGRDLALLQRHEMAVE